MNKNTKSINWLRHRLIGLIIALMLLTAITMLIIFLLFREQQETNKASQNILTTMTFAAELRKSSDNLSRFALSYLASQDTFYKERYHQELSIRKGQIPRPSNYIGGHWETTYLNDSSITPNENALAISFKQRVLNSGIPERQVSTLLEIEALSDTLSKLEVKLFLALENRSLPTKEAIHRLLDPLSDYGLIKSEIVKNIDRFYRNEILLHDIDLEQNDTISNKLIIILTILIVFTILIFALIVVTVLHINQHKVKELEEEISERKNAERKLSNNHIKLINAQRIANFASWEYDSETQSVIWSDQIYDLLEIEGKPQIVWYSLDTDAHKHFKSEMPETTVSYLDFIHPEDKASVLQVAKEQLKAVQSHRANYRLKLKNGKVKYISSVTEVKRNEDSLIITGVLKDITKDKISAIKLKNSHKELLRINTQLQEKEKELNKTNQELYAHKNKLETLIEQKTKELMFSQDLLNAFFKELPLGVVLFDKKGKVKETNPISMQLLNMPKEEILSHDISEWVITNNNSELLSPDQFPVVQALRENKPISNKEIGIKRPDGSLIWMNCHVAVLSEEYGGGVLLIYADISEKKKIEQDIIHAKEQAEKAYKSKSQFLSNMSHEIRTPLHAIIGFAELLGSKIEDKQLKHYASTIQSAGKNLSSLINDILDLAKIEAGKISLTNELIDLLQFKKELRSLFTLKASEKDLMLEIKLTSSVPRYVLIDELRLRQILFNLISNAIKFTAKGHVTVTINAKEITEDTISLHLTVKDSGKGINQDKLNEIFDDFSQESEEVSKNFGGTGLGLSITRRLVNLFNGEISVKSNIGIGSTFEIVLPEIEISPNTLTLTSLSSSKTVDLSKVCILVVDDNNDNRNLMVEHLRDLNAKILVAKNGLEATEQAESQKPDLILMDIKMPVMDGYQAAKLIINNETTAHIPIIACTASAFSQVENHILQVGFKGYLRKPVLKKDLIEELSKHLTHTPLTDGEKIIPKKNIQERFKQEIMPAWENFKATKIKNSKINLAKKIVEIAKRLDNKHLEKIGTDLTEAIYEFDVAKTNMLINKIEALINND